MNKKNPSFEGNYQNAREEFAQQRRAMLEEQCKETIRLLKSRKSLLATMMSDFDHLDASSSKVGDVLDTLKSVSVHELETRTTEPPEISQTKGLLTNHTETHGHALALIQHLVLTISGSKPVANPKTDAMGLGKVIEHDKKHIDDLQPSVTVAKGAVKPLREVAKANHVELNQLIQNIIANSSTQTIEMLLNKLSHMKDRQSRIAGFIQTRGDYYQKERKLIFTDGRNHDKYD